MSRNSAIEWTDDTWNPFVGCSIVSPGCIDCYAMELAARLLDGNPKTPHYAGTTRYVNGNAVWTGKLALAPEHIIAAPLGWRKPRRIFVNSMGDLFHEDAPIEWIDRVLAIAAQCPQHVFQILIKRPQRMCAYADTHPIPPYVWLGTSCEDQRRYDERIDALHATKAKVRFLSLEPLLGPIEPDWLPEWVIAGGESGRDYRPMDVEWARSLRDACAASGPPFFIKQMAGKLPIPSDLMIRQWP
jgi:protein gp37